MISVIIPVYNSAPYLRKCLDGVLKQTYKDLEIICVDDGSTDNSVEILKQVAEEDSRVKYLLQENAGAAAARNMGLTIARGDYIAFVDSDDIVEPEMYEVLLNLASEYAADISHCGYRKVYSDDTVREVLGTKQLLVQSSEEALRCLLTGQHFTGGVWNKLYAAHLLTDVRFDTGLTINEDILFNVEAFLQANRVVFLDLPLYHYYDHAGSACNRTSNLKKCQDGVVVAQKTLNICKETAVERYAKVRLHSSLCNLYREQLMQGIPKEIKLQTREQLRKVTQSCETLSTRARLNSFFMIRFPMLYRLVYSIYNALRKPNWDL